MPVLAAPLGMRLEHSQSEPGQTVPYTPAAGGGCDVVGSELLFSPPLGTRMRVCVTSIMPHRKGVDAMLFRGPLSVAKVVGL